MNKFPCKMTSVTKASRRQEDRFACCIHNTFRKQLLLLDTILEDLLRSVELVSYTCTQTKMTNLPIVLVVGNIAFHMIFFLVQSPHNLDAQHCRRYMIFCGRCKCLHHRMSPSICSKIPNRSMILSNHKDSFKNNTT